MAIGICFGMTEQFFWFFFLLFLFGMFCIGYFLYCFKKRKVDRFVIEVPEYHRELDSEDTMEIAGYWFILFSFLIFGVLCVIFGLLGMFGRLGFLFH